MSSIDERVVEAKFDNKQFQTGVKDTLSSLDSLKRGLNMEGATKGLSDLESATGRVKRGIDVMRIAAYTAIATIAHQATIAGEQFLKSFTVGPLIDGLHEYETQLNSVQTILSNTKWEHKNLEDVNGALDELNHYADKTIYNFSEMARNVGTFTAAGVKLDTSVQAIQGIANLAAVSGSNAQQASTAMYQLSQAISSGTVKLMDWNSVVNAGMGGKVFQDALKETARVHGVAIDKMVKEQGSFRNTLQEGWLSSKILTESLAKFTMQESEANRKLLEKQGYNEKQINQIFKLGKMSTDAATKVKTFTQLLGTLKEAAGSGWAQSWELIIGDFNQAKKLWTGVNDVIGGAISRSADARNKLLAGWQKGGGRDDLIAGLKAGFEALLSVLKPIRDAFREIFPKKTVEDLLNMTSAFRDFMENLKIGEETADKLKRVFAGLFAILDIGWQLIKAGAHFIGQMFGTIGHTSRGVLDFVASIGDMLVALDEAIKKGDGFTKFFDKVHNVLAPIIQLLGITRIRLLDIGIATAATFKGFTETAPKVLNAITGAIHKFFNNFTGAFKFDSVLQGVNAGLFAGLLLLIRKFIKHLESKKSTGALQSFVDKITEPFHELTETLKTMQKAIMATTILEIAAAVALLTASVIALSFIDTAKLAKALAAITAMFAQLIGALWLFNRVGGASGLISTSAGLILFATAIRVLTSSVKALAKLSWNELAKGLAGVTALIGGLIVATRSMQGNTAGMIRAGTGLLILAAAIKVLASAVGDFAELSWGQIAKGLAGVGATLLALTLFTRFAKAGAAGISQGAGLLLLATGIKVLADAATEFAKLSWGQIAKGLTSIGAILGAFALFSKGVGNPISLLAAGASLVMISGAMVVLAKATAKFAELSWGQIAKGLVSMAGGLAIITVALNAMPITSVLSAAALMGISVAIVALSGALKVMGSMSWESVAKSLVVLAGALTIIAIAMQEMVFALPGAAALLVVAAALAILVPELALLGAMSWEDIAKGLVALAGAFAVFGISAALLSETLPAMFGLAGAIALLGVGLALIGAAVYLFATGLQILAIAGAGAGAAIKLLVTDIIDLLPVIAKAVGETLVLLAQAIVKAAPDLIVAAIVLIDGLLFAINREGPKIIRTFFHLLLEMVDRISEAVPKIARAALQMLIGILDAISDKTPDIVRKVVNIVYRFLEAMAAGTPKIVRAAVDWIVAIINGISDNLDRILDAGTDLIISFLKGVGQNGVEIANATLDVIVDFINGLADAIDSHVDDFRDAGKNIAMAMANGMTFGLAGKVGDIASGAANLGKSALKGIGGALGIGSPSKEFCKIGKRSAEGFANGLIGGKDNVTAAWQKLHDDLKEEVQKTKAEIEDYTQKLKDLKEHPTKNAAEIEKMTKKLHESTLEFNASKAALKLVNDGMDKQHDRLIRMGKRYDELSEKIDKWNQKLADAKRVRDDYERSLIDQYNTSPEISADTQLSDYLEEKKKEIVDTQSYIDVLAKLREMGLKDAAYKELLAKGPEALPFAEQILAGGTAAVDQMNDLNSQMRSEAKDLADTASKELYQAGVDSAQGMVDGLKKKRKDLADEMKHLAHILVKKLKQELGIRSPSRVFDDLGQFTGKGLALGLKKSVPHIQKATKNVAQNTIESMRQAIRDMNDTLSVDPNMNPTIKPVLDLSAVRKQARGVGHILGTHAAYLKAVDASAGYQANVDAMSPGDITEDVASDITFVQNNYSPKALSSADIYRSTNNQLSRAKGALNPSAA